MVGYFHSKESFGTVDGPGIRYVLFLQGCPLRCLYCHNPDTWALNGKEITVEEIIKDYKKNEAFYNNGGITVSGGEPLLQIDFLSELFTACKENNIHTCIDTSGATFKPKDSLWLEKLDKLLLNTDLVMLDIKHIDEAKHKKLTGCSNSNILLFAKYLESKNIPVWIRHVVVSGITDNDQDLFNLGKFLSTLKNIKALDVIPYHTLGVNKYKELSIEYKLKDVAPSTLEQTQEAKEIILKGYKAK